MKVHLMSDGQDVDRERDLPAQSDALIQDLELETLFRAMAVGDGFHYETARQALLQSLTEPATIRYRQAILTDCLGQSEVVREMYDLAVEAVDGERKIHVGFLRDSPEAILSRALQALEFFVPFLKRLRRIGDEHAASFASSGFTTFFAMLATELDDGYFLEIERQLRELRFRRGVLVSAELGRGNKGVRSVLRRPRERSWRERLSFSRTGYSFQIPDRDESGARAVAELRGRGVNLVANALAQSTDHITSFFAALRSELSFYVGCLNLQEGLVTRGLATTMPTPAAASERRLVARGLYDPTLVFTLPDPVVANDIDADGKALIMVTGANQGGKSTFLRSVGVAQLMMQSGMFVAAETLEANLAAAVFTHYKREEDTAMESGKLDEELARMSAIADLIEPNALLLSNESFAATNEREGSQIARHVLQALLEANVKIVFVTHLYALAHGIAREGRHDVLFLRAERRDDGQRTFRLAEGDPLPTSYGGDLYEEIFGKALPDDATMPDTEEAVGTPLPGGAAAR